MFEKFEIMGHCLNLVFPHLKILYSINFFNAELQCRCIQKFYYYYQNSYTITLYTHAAISLKSTGTILKSCCQREGHLLICVLCFHPKKFDELNTKKSQLSEKHVLFLYQRDLDIMAGFRIYFIQ